MTLNKHIGYTYFYVFFSSSIHYPVAVYILLYIRDIYNYCSILIHL